MRWPVTLLAAFCFSCSQCSTPPQVGDGGGCVDTRTDNENCGRCGTKCATGEACAAGICRATACGATQCGAAHVCINGACEDRACIGVFCASGSVCVDGLCVPKDCQGRTCGPDEACVGGACVDPRCVGVLCPTGQTCRAGICRAPDGCSDGMRTGSETDVDCGGTACPRCGIGRGCDAGTDCDSGLCSMGACRMSPCANGTIDPPETDVDCGGPTCSKCGTGQRCDAGSDCRSTACTTNRCDAPALFGGPQSLAAGSTVMDIAVADLDGDGALDIVTANQNSSDLSIFYGIGDGGFLPATSTGVSACVGTRSMSVTVGDFNGDGVKDLVSAAPIGCSDECLVTKLAGAGSRNFLAGSTSMSPPFAGIGRCGHQLISGRFDGDARDDLMTTGAYKLGFVTFLNTAAWFGVTGSALLGTPVALPSAGLWLAAADVDGDGDLDAVVHDDVSAIRILLNSDGGTFTPGQEFVVPAGGGHLALAQLRGSPTPEVVVASDSAGRVSVAVNTGNGLFLAPVTYSVASPVGVAVGDVDGDGRPDIVAGSVGVAVLSGLADGGFAPAAPYATTLGQVGEVQLGDFNGDGKLDVVTHNGSQVHVLLNNAP